VFMKNHVKRNIQKVVMLQSRPKRKMEVVIAVETLVIIHQIATQLNMLKVIT